MKGNQKVIEQLQKLLEAELTSADQYVTHSSIYGDWGLTELEERLAHEAEEERGHAQAIINRMLFLEGSPDLSKRVPMNIGGNVEEMLKSDLEFEYSVVKSLRLAIAICEEENDYRSREILNKLLEDTEEDHTYWLEKQLGLIGKMGLENYIQSKL